MDAKEKDDSGISEDSVVYTTGCFLVPRRIKIDGDGDNWQWRWVVSDFGWDGGEYLNGENCFFRERADNMPGLVQEVETD